MISRFKKCLSAILIFGMLFGTCAAADADVNAADTSNSVLFDLVSLGIVKGDENGDYHLDRPVSRAEFAAMMVRTLHYPSETMPQSGFDVFDDVKPEDWFYQDVQTVYYNGIMRGKAENIFDPTAQVTYNEAVKTMVTMLGFASVAEEKGGYPTGYLMEGARLGLSANVSSSAELTMQDVVNLIYNSLDIDRLSSNYDGSYVQKEGDTLRSLHMAEEVDEGLVFGRGVVEANYYSYLYTASSTIKEDEVFIDGMRMRTGDTDAANYLGYEVEYYYRLESDNTRTLVSVRPSVFNTVTAFDAKQFAGFGKDYVEYMPSEESNRAKKIKIAADAVVLKNGRPLATVDDSTFDIKQGELMLIENSRDSSVDVVLLREYSNIIVKNVNGSIIELKDPYRWNGSRYINLEEQNDNIIHVFYNAERQQITLEDVKENDVLSILASADGQLNEYIVSDSTATGVVSDVSDDQVGIDEQEYPLYAGTSLSEFVGKEVVLRLDYKGYVAECDMDDVTTNYGYVAEIDKSGPFNDFRVKMLLSSPIEYKEEKNEQNLDDANTIPTLVCRNEAVVVYSLSENASVNGTKVANDPDALQEGLYEYKTNSDGEITKLISPNLAGGGTGMKFNAYDNTFGGSNFDIPFGIDENTNILCVPKNNVTSDEDYLVPLIISNKIAGSTFDVRGYGYDDATKKVDLVVFDEIMSADTIPEVRLDSALIGLVSKKSEKLGEDSETVWSYQLLCAEGELEFEADPSDQPQLDFNVGDLIWYVKDNAGEIANGKLIYSFDDRQIEEFFMNEGREDEILCGQVTDISYHDIDPVPNNLVTTLTVVTDRGAMPVKLLERNTPPIFMYDIRSASVSYTKVDMSQLMPGNPALDTGDYFFAVRPYGETVKAGVIIRK